MEKRAILSPPNEEIKCEKENLWMRKLPRSDDVLSGVVLIWAPTTSFPYTCALASRQRASFKLRFSFSCSSLSAFVECFLLNAKTLIFAIRHGLCIVLRQDFGVSGFRCGVLHTWNKEVLSAVKAAATWQAVSVPIQVRPVHIYVVFRRYLVSMPINVSQMIACAVDAGVVHVTGTRLKPDYLNRGFLKENFLSF